MLARFRLRPTLFLVATCGDSVGMPDVPPPPPPPPAAGIALQEITSAVAFPVDLASPPGDATRLFVVEKAGRIRIIKDGALLPTAFLDIVSRVSSNGERGLLGLAFTPDFATSGRFVISYSNSSGDTRISTMRTGTDPDRADGGSEQVILSVNQPFSNHNGGQVAFGPDGMLYIGLGDGGSGGDPQGNGQDPNTLLGKLLRLEVLGDGSARVPADNPFVGQAGRRPEIWSTGLRNPWRFSFDPSTGDLYIADVGQGALEEVNVVTAASGRGRGLNFGWKIMEGTNCFSPSSGCDQTGLTLPVLTYGRGDGCSVTGGYVYRGANVPDVVGHYFYADYCTSWIRSFRFQGGAATARQEWTGISVAGGVTTFGVDGSGEMYVATNAGRVYKIVPRP
jgi:glucose/arabinose dehydrogenase